MRTETGLAPDNSAGKFAINIRPRAAFAWYEDAILASLQSGDDAASAIVGMFNAISDAYRPDQGVLVGGMAVRTGEPGGCASRSDEIVALWVRLLGNVLGTKGMPFGRSSALARTIVDGILAADALGRALGDRLIFHCALERLQTQCLAALEQPATVPAS